MRKQRSGLTGTSLILYFILSRVCGFDFPRLVRRGNLKYIAIHVLF